MRIFKKGFRGELYFYSSYGTPSGYEKGKYKSSSPSIFIKGEKKLIYVCSLRFLKSWEKFTIIVKEGLKEKRFFKNPNYRNPEEVGFDTLRGRFIPNDYGVFIVANDIRKKLIKNHNFQRIIKSIEI